MGADIMNGTISVYLQNGGTGTWLALPAGRDDFQKALHEIKATDPDSVTIGQYKTGVALLPVELLMNADLDAVNYLAARLAGLSPNTSNCWRQCWNVCCVPMCCAASSS